MYLKLVLALIATFICGIYYAYSAFQYRMTVSILPIYVQVENVVYNESELSGLGPGGNEAGIVVYRLSPKFTSRLKSLGIAYLNNQPQRQDSSGRGLPKYYWSVTPGGFCYPLELVRNNPIGGCRVDALKFAGAYLPDFLPDSEAVHLANEAMNGSNNFYTYTGSMFVIVDAEKGLAIAVYNG
ncbi:hypothetical protein ABIE45_003857 [Methylobacterium sp. OAE515]|uniref:hypothetical protein n=1 Tax=Methylobacterium sp. OAE515 TaxID=2817895 RepID=UPI00359D99ED